MTCKIDNSLSSLLSHPKIKVTFFDEIFTDREIKEITSFTPLQIEDESYIMENFNSSAREISYSQILKKIYTLLIRKALSSPEKRNKLSHFVNITRGIKGDDLSGVLFVLSLSPGDTLLQSNRAPRETFSLVENLQREDKNIILLTKNEMKKVNHYLKTFPKPQK